VRKTWTQETSHNPDSCHRLTEDDTAAVLGLTRFNCAPSRSSPEFLLDFKVYPVDKRKVDPGSKPNPSLHSESVEKFASAVAGISKTGASGENLFSFVVHLVFIFSGASALLYQLVWQRSLLLIFGSNAESVALVITAFMIGLGIGSLAGGEISKKPISLILCFAASEVLIGIYGLFSLDLFHWAGTHSLTSSTLQTGLLCFGLVLVPTFLMGATLPLLVAYRVKTSSQVGRSVASLYFVNTLGAGIGALFAAFYLLGEFGLSGSLIVAALANFISAVLVLIAWLGANQTT